jgi:hypothetical protein
MMTETSAPDSSAAAGAQRNAVDEDVHAADVVS